MTAPLGLCPCGCGEPAPLARNTDRRYGWVTGEPRPFRQGHHMRRVARDPDTYPNVSYADGVRRIHRVRAELARGKPLPRHAVVHHANGTRDSGPLVICQDRAYHMLLHARMRVKAAGGNPNTDKICGTCKTVLNKSQFCRNATELIDGLNGHCRACQAMIDRHRGTRVRL